MNHGNNPIHRLDASSFDMFYGATLRWTNLRVGHGEFGLLASELNNGLAQIWFIRTRFIDLPTSMHEVRLRTATITETNELLTRLPSKMAQCIREGDLEQKDHLVITCEEGIYSILAHLRGYTLVSEEGFRQSMEETGDLSQSLWKGGPSLVDL